MGKLALASNEKVIIDRFRELSEDGKHRLIAYVEFLYQKEKSHLNTNEDNEQLFSEEDIKSLSPIIEEVQEFLKNKPKRSTQEALREICAGVFESEEDLASNHDFYLYGAPKRK
jgi:hypothetical protein